MRLLVRFTALLVVALAAFAANAYAQEYWACMLFPRAVPRPYSEMVSAAFVGAAAAAAVSALPLVRLFNRGAWLAALFVALPVVALRAPEISAAMPEALQPVSVMAWVEMLSYTSAVICAAWLLSRHSRWGGCRNAL